MSKLTRDFYQREDVLSISRELLGKILCTNFDGKFTNGMIVETEAYAGETDHASHAYGGRRTTRTETMYSPGGTAYVYLCYGIHHLFNVVTNVENTPHAVLIRAVEPIHGIDDILKRRKLNTNTTRSKIICPGPGTVSQGLGITTKNNGESLMGNKIWIEESGLSIAKKDITCGARIGVDYAQDDAFLPFRFRINLTKAIL